MSEDLYRHDVAHVSYAELLTPTLDESERFFTELLGMEVSARDTESVYLRGVRDYELYSLRLTAFPTSGLGRLGLRARTPEALQRRVAALQATGLGEGWTESVLAHGPSYRFRDPDGHRFEIFSETERYVAPPALAPSMRNQPQRQGAQGLAVRGLDHINIMTRDIAKNRKFLQNTLNFQLREKVQLEDGREAGAWMSMGILAHEVIYVLEAMPTAGRLHHLAFTVDSREEVLRSADLFLDNHVRIEAPPSKHTAAQSFYCYGIEPGGNRIEITTNGYFVFDPEHPPTVWDEAEYRRGPAWGAKLPASFHTYGTPPYGGTEVSPL